RKGRESWELLTNVLVPEQLSGLDALSLYPWRWKVERVFFDLKEVLNLHRFYTSSPNGVAMQVYAAALVHTALGVAQGHIAQASAHSSELCGGEHLRSAKAARDEDLQIEHPVAC